MRAVDTAVVGGGIIGLTCAFALAEQGQSVALFDDSRPGRSTRAAAGMLAPLAEADSDGFFVRRGTESLALYPDFLDRIEESSGERIEIHGPGLLRIARTEEAETLLCRRLSWQSDVPLPQVRLSRSDVLALEPGLPDDIRCGALSVKERHLQPRKLQAALFAACRNKGVAIVPSRAELMFDGDRASGITSSKMSLTAANYLIAGGVWSPELLALLGMTAGAVYPVKGQACAVAYRDNPPVRHTIFTHSVYVVPRPGGEIVVGATQEPEAGYDTNVDLATVTHLREAADDFVDGMAALPLVESWSGLRPFSADGLPIVGRVPAYDNVFAAAGHGRNGVLFAPLTGKLLTSAIVDGAETIPELNPMRFARSAA